MRGAILSGQVMVVPFVAGLAVGAGCVLLGVGIVAAPFYGSYLLIKRQRAKTKKQGCKTKSRK